MIMVNLGTQFGKVTIKVTRRANTPPLLDAALLGVGMPAVVHMAHDQGIPIYLLEIYYMCT